MEIERIERGGQILAIIIRAGASESGVRFFTPPEFSQQLGYMQHPAGKKYLSCAGAGCGSTSTRLARCIWRVESCAPEM